MKPQIIRGPLDALEARLGDNVRAFRSRSPLAPLTILIGSTLLRPYLRRRLAELHGGVVNVRLQTISDLASTLSISARAARGAERLTGLGDRVITEEVAGQADGYFERVAQSPGFAEALHRLFAELRQADLDHESFDKAAAELSTTRPASAPKLQGLAMLYAQAQQHRAIYCTNDDLLRLADPERFDSTELLVYGVWNLTSLQQQMLEQLMEHVPVTFYLPEGSNDANGAHADLRTWLYKKDATEEFVTLDAKSTSLTRLQSGIFGAPSGDPAPPDETVRLVSAPDTPREVREAARTCLRWASQGIGFHEMAIAYRQADTYRGLIDEIFGQAGIPVYLHDGRPCIERPAGRSLATLISLIGSRLSRAQVMEFLTETRLPVPTAEGFGGFEPAAWDQISRRAGIVEGRGQWFDRLDARAHEIQTYIPENGEPSERVQSQLEEIDRFKRFLEALFDQLEDWPQRDSWNGFLERLAALASDYIDEIDPILAELTTLDRLKTVSDDVTFSRFVRTVMSTLLQVDSTRLYNIQAGAFGREGVTVVDVNSLRHLRFRAVALLGLTERSFPSPPRQDALLLDQERIALSDLIPGELPPRALGADPEPLQFTVAIAAAEERLQLSFARGDAGGTRAHLPSYFFRAAAETLTGRPVTIADIDSLPPEIFERVPANRFGAAVPEESLTEGEYDRTLIGSQPELGKACLRRRSEPFARACQAWDARWRSSTLTAWDGMLGADRQIAVSHDQRPISPTRLETYATCPYQYFLQFVLRLEQVEEPETVERLNALDRGRLIHDTLDQFLTRFSKQMVRGTEAGKELRAELRAIAEEVCREAERQGRGGYPLVWEFDKTALFEDLDLWLELELQDQQGNDLHPHAFEVRFGPSWSGQAEGSEYSVDDPLTMQFDGGTLQFHGRIDRIDWNDERTSFRVIDYKTGREKKNGKEEFTQGTTLQLPIYLLAAAEALKRQGLDVTWEDGRAEYFFSTTRGSFKRLHFTGRTLQERWDEFLQLLSDMTGQIARGDFHPEPGPKGDNCTFCLGKQVCDARVLTLSQRKAESREPRFIRIQQVP